MSIAHYFTLARIAIGPFFLFVYLAHETLQISSYALPYVLLFLLMIAELSDALDGYLARKLNQVTDLGKILDPMADSIYRSSVFLTFTLPPVELPMILIFMFLYRDSVISTLRTICALKGFALAARPSGKLKAVIQAVTMFIITGLLIPYSWEKISSETLSMSATIVGSIAAFYAFLSGIDYLYANRFYISKLLRTNPVTD